VAGEDVLLHSLGSFTNEVECVSVWVWLWHVPQLDWLWLLLAFLQFRRRFLLLLLLCFLVYLGLLHKLAKLNSDKLLLLLWDVCPDLLDFWLTWNHWEDFIQDLEDFIEVNFKSSFFGSLGLKEKFEFLLFLV